MHRSGHQHTCQANILQVADIVHAADASERHYDQVRGKKAMCKAF